MSPVLHRPDRPGKGDLIMIEMYYILTFALSMLLTGIYMFIWHKHFDVHITLIFVLIPVSNLGYMLFTRASSLETALAANKIIYLDGCFLQMILMLAIFSLCEIRLSRWLRVVFLALSTALYLSVLTIGDSSLFYTDVRLVTLPEGGQFLAKHYGVMHTVFYGMVILYFLLSISAILYAFVRKNQISRKLLLLLILPEIFCMAAYFLRDQISPALELLPAAFIFSQLVYLVIVWRIALYDITESAIATMVEDGDTGFITFDLHDRYLGSNETAKNILPALRNLTVDLGLNRSREMKDLLLPWLKDFEAHPDEPERNRHDYQQGDKYYLCTVGWLPGKKHHRGYQLFLTDNTMDRTYQAQLEKDVRKKTAHIVEMHDNLILSMATMVESRDNSTGGHIRRTSEGVRLLADAMKALPAPPAGYPLDDRFCQALIKAAPMHDLGKIAVEDSILRKPGRFSPEEYETMKTHAAQGARIVHEILKSTRNEFFCQLAENVAHYHHERWDGSGYPDGLKGTEIPPEARIMAVADVYDALVSKRVYKEKMSFEKAHAIIMDGMGSQFDPALQPVYLAAKPHLEAYYNHLEA